jgi:glycosyltransferase involved in cell wall biosynthesis
VYATLRRADAIIVLTPEMQSATERRLRNVTVRILPNPVDPFIFEPVASVVRDSMHVAFIGRFAREKGVFDLLDATRRLIDQGSGVRVTLAGGKAEADVDAAIERLGLRQTVTFRNWLATHDVAELLRRCTMLALPSHTEGVPMVLLEALMCGTPIVTCPVGGIPLIVKDGRNGLLVPPGNFAALGIAIGRLLSSPELCREISINNIADSAQFRAESIVQDLRAIYARLSSVAGHVVSSS